MSKTTAPSNFSSFRLAVIGPHGRGKISLLLHRPDEGIELVASCSLTTDGLEAYYEKCGPGFFATTDYREIVNRSDIDTVMVCSPDFAHAEHAVAALEAGKNVFLEKPIATKIEDCDRILRAAAKSSGKLYVGHNMRFFPVMRKMRELIHGGRIGRVEAIWCRHFVSIGGDAYFKDWHSEQKNVNSLLLQKGAHDIDVIHWLAGGTTRRVVGMGKLSVYSDVTDRRSEDFEPGKPLVDSANWPPLAQKGLSPNIDVEDHSMILMQLDNGVQASYSECHYTPDYWRNYTVIGTEGRIENYGATSDSSKWATVHLWNRRTGYSEMGHEVFRVPHVEGSHGGADSLMLQDFRNFLSGQPSESAAPLDARQAVAVGVLGAQSVRQGSTPFDVPPFIA